MAAQEDEIVVEELFEGKMHLSQSFQFLVEQAEETLELDEAKRQRPS